MREFKNKNNACIHHYLEVRDGERVVKRIPTSLDKKHSDTVNALKSKKGGQKLFFVSSSVKEKVIQ